MTSTPKHDDQHLQAWAGEYLPDLLIETGKANGLVEIGQSTGNGEHSAIEIHPSQVLYIAQKLGMVRELSGDEAAAREALLMRALIAERDLARLRMAVDLATSMATRLHDNVRTMHGQGHEDLTQEMEQALALVDLLDLINEDPPTNATERKETPATDLQRSCNVSGNAPVTPAPLPAAQARAPGPARAVVVPPPTPGAPGLFDGGPA